MATTKLTLSADRNLIEEAKKLARRQGTSLSSLVSRYLRALLEQKSPSVELGPLTRRAIGLAKLPPRMRKLTDRELIEEAIAHRHLSGR